jgi:hypothetical protein
MWGGEEKERTGRSASPSTCIFREKADALFAGRPGALAGVRALLMSCCMRRRGSVA